MKRSSVIKRTLALTLACVLLFSAAACGKKKTKTTKASDSSAEDTSDTTPIVSIPDTEATTVLAQYGGQLPENDQEITWTEEEMEAKVMYVKGVSDYLKVRKGPGTDYDVVGKLTPGMQVIVIGKTGNNWFKLEDGYYVSGEYISLTP